MKASAIIECEQGLQPASPTPTPTPAPPAAVPDDLGGVSESLSRIRRSIGGAMLRSQQTTATCHTVVECDFSGVERRRRELGVTALPLVARAVIDVIRRFPDLNATLDGETVTRFGERVHLGIAVSLGEDGRAAHRARHVGFVFQSFQLIAHLSALENVMLPLELRGDREARRKATAMLERVGLGKRLSHKPVLLSGGEQQRVALARAFVVHPDVLMADEPTGSLDHATGLAVMDLMFELNRENGTTLILVTHDEQIARRCHSRIRISAGHLA